MAYQAGIPGEPNALVHNISSNIQKLTLLSNTVHTLQQKQQQGNHLAKETDRLIKAFSALPVGPDQRQRKLQKDRLLNDFSAALNSFQKIQRQAADKEREFVAKVRASSRVSVSNLDYDFNVSNCICICSCSDSQLQDQTEAITEDDLRLIEERESAIRQLESDITDINDIFKDLGVMVHEQGDMIDSIEANVENADTNVQSATQQLARAAEYQRSSRKKICVLVILLAVVGVVIGLIIWAAVRK
uniref:Syntaxin-7 n=1 Tax=Monopterus albus TaxID=43700 RepID=A0A3Q3QZE6_MONAL